MSALRIVVHGTPAPQGSKRHIGKGVMIESSKKVKPWRQDVRAAALDAIEAGGPTFPTGGVSLDVVFRLPRPKGHYRTGRNAEKLRDSAPPTPAVKPDLDKLIRSTLDALGEAGVWRDDAQVVQVDASKAYAAEPFPYVGAGIDVRCVDE